MITLTVNGIQVKVSPGDTVLQAASAAGVAVPVLCHSVHRPRGEAESCCMVCAVLDRSSGRMLAACSALAEDGMMIETAAPEVLALRRRALELLLSEHAGDCEAPCTKVCPAGLEIPPMLRALAAGRYEEAQAIISRTMAMPETLGRLCEAPCERGCRRGRIDQPLSIRESHRWLAASSPRASGGESPGGESSANSSVALSSQVQGLSAPGLLSGSGDARPLTVGIVGSGITSWSAAHALLQGGVIPMVYERSAAPGGHLLTSKASVREVAAAEIRQLLTGGAFFHGSTEITPADFASLRGRHAALLLACGEVRASGLAGLVKTNEKGFHVDAAGESSLSGVFAAGDAVRPGRTWVHAAGEGRRAATALLAHLAGRKYSEKRRFSSRLGPLDEDEMAILHSSAQEKGGALDSSSERVASVAPEPRTDEVILRADAGRCLHCDCRAAESCRLRALAEEYGARSSAFPQGARRPVRSERGAAGLVFESGKCITCGRCVRIAEEMGEDPGLGYHGRGTKLTVAVPLGGSLFTALSPAAAIAVAAACPVGALTCRDQKL